MTSQHNHHCIISWLGENWFITGCSPGVIRLGRRINEHATLHTSVCTRFVDWERYCAVAVRWDYEQAGA